MAWGDAGYQGVVRPEENQRREVQWEVAMRVPALAGTRMATEIGRFAGNLEQLKARVRAKAEHPFHLVKNIFQLKKVRYRGLAKNTVQLFTLFGLATLLIAKQRLFELDAHGAS